MTEKNNFSNKNNEELLIAENLEGGMGHNFEKPAFQSSFEKSLKNQNEGFIKTGNIVLEAIKGINFEKTDFRTSFEKSLKRQNEGLIKTGNIGLEAIKGINFEKTDFRTSFEKSLKRQNESLIKTGNIRPGSILGRGLNNLEFGNLTIENIALPISHINKLDKKRIHIDFKATRFSDKQTYLQNIETNEFVNLNDVEDYYALYHENLGFNNKEIFDFIRYAKSYPMLILSNEVGKKIYDELRNNKIDEFQGSEDIELYRTRPHNTWYPLHDEELGKPPYDFSAGGRFDSYGIPLLYTANTKAISVLEVFSESHEYYHIKEFSFNNNDFKLADLTKLGEKFTNLLLRPMDNDQKNKQDYIIPRFISECIKSAGYDGFVVRSSQGEQGELNFNFFNDITPYLKEKNYCTKTKEEAYLLIDNYFANFDI